MLIFLLLLNTHCCGKSYHRGDYIFFLFTLYSIYRLFMITKKNLPKEVFFFQVFSSGVLPNTRNNLPRCKISTNGNHKTKHSEASIKNLCLRGPSEFHLFFSLVSFRKLIHRMCQKNKEGNSSDCKNNFGHQKTPKNSLPVAT